MESALVFRFHTVINCSAAGTGLLFQNCRERGAGVFGVDVDASGENALMRDVSSAKIEPALNRKVSLVLDLLCDEFAEDDLFGEIFASHDDARMGAACGEYHERKTNKSNAFRPARAIHVTLPVVA